MTTAGGSPEPSRAVRSRPEPSRAARSRPEPSTAARSRPEPSRAARRSPEPSRNTHTLPRQSAGVFPHRPQPASVGVFRMPSGAVQSRPESVGVFRIRSQRHTYPSETIGGRFPPTGRRPEQPGGIRSRPETHIPFRDNRRAFSPTGRSRRPWGFSGCRPEPSRAARSPWGFSGSGARDTHTLPRQSAGVFPPPEPPGAVHSRPEPSTAARSRPEP